MRKLLDQPSSLQSDREKVTIRDLTRYTPCKPRTGGALLFPFLALEAKAEWAPVNFSGIQTQTASPIHLLLNLQRDLQSLKPSQGEVPAPLVWFLGYRGEDWKLYGCYIDSGSEAQPVYVSSLMAPIMLYH